MPAQPMRPCDVMRSSRLIRPLDVMRSSRPCRLSRCGPVTSYDLRDHAGSLDVMRSFRPCRPSRCGHLCHAFRQFGPCGLSDHAGSADAAIYVMRSSRLIRQFGSCGLRDHAGSADAATYVMHFGNLGHAVFVTMPAQPMRLSSPCGLCCHAVCVAMRSL